MSIPLFELVLTEHHPVSLDTLIDHRLLIFYNISKKLSSMANTITSETVNLGQSGRRAINARNLYITEYYGVRVSGLLLFMPEVSTLNPVETSRNLKALLIRN